MMNSTPLNSSALQEFLLDAQILLTKAQECLQHLELIDNDPDACHCLDDTLGTLAQRANDLGLQEVAHYANELGQLLAPACQHPQLEAQALPAVGACLTLLAWQLELVDARTGRLNLDTCEQTQLLGELASALGQPFTQTCAPCQANDHLCNHPHPTLHHHHQGK
ncbi:histidine kinase [Pseudomonas sp. xss_2]|uniref:histidine kinase n=1 Tax=Pseudomonas sp. xss_2 TaxID=3367215 RepID=UPI00370BAC35